MIATNDEQRSVGALEADGVLSTLRSHFAPILLNDTNLAITYGGMTLDPAQEIERDSSITISFGDVGEREASVRVIEWRSGTHRALYF